MHSRSKLENFKRSALCHFLFVVLIDRHSMEVTKTVLLYLVSANDLAKTVETEEELQSKYGDWQEGFKRGGLTSL